MTEQNINIDKLFKAGKPIDDAINKATREAVKRHQQAQQPVVVWRDGKIVWLSVASGYRSDADTL
jgi:predicted HAD superfamily phosphohydrolase YqeG